MLQHRSQMVLKITVRITNNFPSIVLLKAAGINLGMGENISLQNNRNDFELGEKEGVCWFFSSY